MTAGLHYADFSDAIRDPEYAARRRKGYEGALRLDGMTSEIKELAATLLNAHAIPQTEPTDALHIATATVYGVDVVLTWNCRHKRP